MIKLSLWIKIIPLFIALLMTLTIVIIFRFLPSRLPLFYSLSWGDGQLATHQQFLILPASIVLITLINSALSWQLHHQQSLFKGILLLFPTVTSIILAITFIKIILNFI